MPNLIKKSLFALATAAALAVPASLAQADLSPAELEQIDGQRGIRVFSSDGAMIGVTRHVRARGDRVRLFLRQSGTRIFASRRKDINITIRAAGLTLNGDTLQVAANKQKLRVRSHTSGNSSFEPIEVILLDAR